MTARRTMPAQMVRLRAAIDEADLGQAREEEFETLDRQSQRYFTEVCGSGRTSRDAILGSGLVACGEADADLSTTYKSRLHEGFGRKHGHRWKNRHPVENL